MTDTHVSIDLIRCVDTSRNEARFLFQFEHTVENIPQVYSFAISEAGGYPRRRYAAQAESKQS